MTRAQRAYPYLGIAVVGLLFFAPLIARPGHLIYSDHSDFLALHLPASQVQVRWWRETGELPLWDPYCFSGQPFSHDSFALYPFQLAFFLVPERWLPESCLGPVMSWGLVVHVIVAGFGAFAYARSQDLGVAGSLVAAFGVMFAGNWLLHVLGAGHYLLGLAWTPFVLLWLERAVRRGSLVAATVAGLFYGLAVWGAHPQWTFYAGLFVGLWTLGIALEEAGLLGSGERSWRRGLRALGKCLGLGAWTALIGGALPAIQLFPLLAAASHSTRAGGILTEDLLALGRQTLFNLVGPSLQRSPFPWSSAWEERGGLGVIVLALAIMAPCLVRTKKTWYRAAVCATLIVFGLGGALLFQRLPLFGMCREPARMFSIVGFPVAYLAGVTVNALLSGATAEDRGLGRFVLTSVVLCVGMLTANWGYALRHDPGQIEVGGDVLMLQPYWLSLALTVPVAWWLLGRATLPRANDPACVVERIFNPSTPTHVDGLKIRPTTHAVAGAWLGIVLIDLWALVWPLVETRAEADVYPESTSVRYLVEHRANHGRVLDCDHGPLCSPLGRGAPLAPRLNLEALRGYNTFDVYRYKKYLQFVADRDEPLVPLRDPLTFPVLSNLPVKNKNLIDLLGVRYLLLPAEVTPSPAWRKVCDDPNPRAYDLDAGGVQDLGPYVLYENPDAFPRAFVTSQSRPLPPEPEILTTLKDADFHKITYLEEHAPSADRGGRPRAAVITLYQPNQVRIKVDEGTPGFLVLTDAWFPGWTCTVNGQAARIYRADYAFRGVEVPAEACEVVYTFAPASFRWGAWVSAVTAIVAATASLLAWLGARRRGAGV